MLRALAVSRLRGVEGEFAADEAGGVRFR